MSAADISEGSASSPASGVHLATDKDSLGRALTDNPTEEDAIFIGGAEVVANPILQSVTNDERGALPGSEDAATRDAENVENVEKREEISSDAISGSSWLPGWLWSSTSKKDLLDQVPETDKKNTSPTSETKPADSSPVGGLYRALTQTLSSSSIHRLEMQEGYLGFFRPCQLQVNPGRLTIDGETSEASVSVHIHLDPCTFESVGPIPDEHDRFEVVTKEKRLIFRCEDEDLMEHWIQEIASAATMAKEKCDSKEWSFVYLNVYNLARDWRVGVLNTVMQDVLGVGGIFHAGVEVYGSEYMFGSMMDKEYEINFVNAVYDDSGISTCEPKACSRHTFRQTECLGVTVLNFQEVGALINRMATEWPADDYRVLGKNCITFCRVFCERLGVRRIPDWVDSLAKSAAERYEVEPHDAPLGEGITDPQEFCCALGHPCVLQAQSFLGGLVETIICEGCFRELPRGEAHWRCAVCSFEICRLCAREGENRTLGSKPDSSSGVQCEGVQRNSSAL